MREQEMAVLQERGFQEVERKSLLYKSRVEYASWGLNLFEGCLHGCRYCYAAALGKRTGRVPSRDGWLQPKVVANALELLEAELDEKAGKIDRVHLSFSTDPFMYSPDDDVRDAIAAISVKAIRAINARGIPVTTLTKGCYPELAGLDPRNQYGLTLVSRSKSFSRSWEPGRAPLVMTLGSMVMLAQDGAKTWASVEPYPTPNIDETAGDVVPLLETLTIVDKIIFGRANGVPAVTEYLKDDPTFYDRIAAEVSAWCRDNGKLLYIKRGTPLHDEATCSILDPSMKTRPRDRGGVGMIA